MCDLVTRQEEKERRASARRAVSRVLTRVQLRLSQYVWWD